jgi:deazaflavin-dependent oxidoreductase (nitroreductase family)
MHVFFYSITNGSIGGRLGGGEILLLTSIGRKTGKKRTWALNYLKEDPDYVIIASNGGQPNNPGWYYNLKEKKKATIKIKKVELEVTSIIADKKERNRLWTKITQQYPFYADYQKKTTREIPVIILKSKS